VLALPRQPLRGAAKLHPPQLGDLKLQLFDFQGTQLDGEFGRLQLSRRRRQFALHGPRKGPQGCGILGVAELDGSASAAWPKGLQDGRLELTEFSISRQQRQKCRAV
jgi:hypothetical protein